MAEKSARNFLVLPSFAGIATFNKILALSSLSSMTESLLENQGHDYEGVGNVEKLVFDCKLFWNLNFLIAKFFNVDVFKSQHIHAFCEAVGSVGVPNPNISH